MIIYKPMRTNFKLVLDKTWTNFNVYINQYYEIYRLMSGLVQD